MKLTKLLPTAGTQYKLPYGGMFECLEVTEPNQCNAIMRNIQSGWTIEAHHIYLREDDCIEWDYSSGGTFTKEDNNS